MTEVKIKPLEWFVIWNGRRAETLLGPYEIAFDEPRFYVSGPAGFSANVTSEDEAKAAAQAHFEARIRSALLPDVSGAEADDEAYEIGKRDGYEQAVQHIDRLTGGDGEYRYCTDHDPDWHTPDAPAMIQRIVDRFEVLNMLDAAHKDGRDIPDDASAMRAVVAESGELFRRSEFAPTPPVSDLREARNQAFREAANLIAEYQIVHTSSGDVLEPRGDGNKHGMAYATAVAALQTEGK